MHDSTTSVQRLYRPAPIRSIRLEDPFFSERIRTNNDVTLPANIRKCRETGRIDAFRLNWKEGMPNRPHIFWDSDFAKVVEGMALSLMLYPDPEREKQLNEFVDLIVSAQQKDGYLNTYFTVVEPEGRWKKLSTEHELYCAGHLMEAAVAHWKATGKRNFLDCMARYADYIAEVFGPAPGQKHGYPGHQEIELALCKLAEATGRKKYADLAAYFINERGKSPNYFETEEGYHNTRYLQADKPIREMQTVRGHAVRALYYLAGAADAAAESGDRSLLEACERLWDNLTTRNLYITGGAGSTAEGEAFTTDYNLPNDSAYAESCASIALVLFASRMLNITGDSRYADTMETALYNGAISGLSLDGEKFFYANPLENDDQMYEHGQQLRKRQPWFHCSCCPTNYCRFLPQLSGFAFSVSDDTFRINLPVASRGDVTLSASSFRFELSGSYPYDSSGSLTLSSAQGEFTLALRIPGWCRSWKVLLNGNELPRDLEKGYLSIRRVWRNGDRLEWEFAMPVRLLHANPRVGADSGRAALLRGPIVYALESIDNSVPLHRIRLKKGTFFTLGSAQGLPEGTPSISGEALISDDTDPLYFEGDLPLSSGRFTAIPSALWQNRGDSSMRIWIPEAD